MKYSEEGGKEREEDGKKRLLGTITGHDAKEVKEFNLKEEEGKKQLVHEISEYDANFVQTLTEIGDDDTKMKTCVITISAMNNFGFVLQLYDSVMSNSPGIDCFV